MVKPNVPGLPALETCWIFRRPELGAGVAVCWHTVAQDMGTEVFWGKNWGSAWKAVGFVLQASS